MKRSICSGMKSSSPLSINSLTRRYLLGVLVVVLFAFVSLMVLGYAFLERDRQKALEHQGRLVSNDIADLIGFYQSIAEGMAKQSVVKDLISFRQTGEAEKWALGMQDLLPDNIGLALIDKEAQVMGQPLSMRLGERCLYDVRRAISYGVAFKTPVHRGVKALSHFDIMAKVHDAEGEEIGAVFISFKLGVIKKRLLQLLPGADYLRVQDSDKALIAEAGIRSQLTEMELADNSAVLPIRGTDWHLQVVMPTANINPLLLTVGTAAMLVFSLLSILLVMYSARLSRFFTRDIELILDNVRNVHKGDSPQKDLHTRSRLQETREIMQTICYLLTDIESFQARLSQLTISDELTGLNNRRGFMEKAETCLKMARRGIESSLVLLDLDYFKQCNDKHGHATGDEVLKSFAAVLRKSTRESDVCARVGGDEFAVILVNDTGTDLHHWHCKVLKRFLTLQQKLRDGQGLDQYCSCSAGMIRINGKSSELSTLLQRADSFLYQAKESGRGVLCAELNEK